jgi:hypothetical protein
VDEGNQCRGDGDAHFGMKTNVYVWNECMDEKRVTRDKISLNE